MYVILVGPAGARKSVATSIGMSIANKLNLKRFSDKITGAALLKDLSENPETLMLKGGKGVMVVTPMIIYASELGVFMGADAYGSGVIADLTDLFDCPSEWKKKTIARGEEIIAAPYVNLLAASTPQTLKDVVPPGAVGQGFTSRVLFVWASGRRKRVPIPHWGQEYEMLLNNLVADLKHISSLQGKFQFSSDGLKAYTSHYMNHPEPEDEFEDERLRNYASRKDVHMLKLAQILSLAANDSLIIGEREIKTSIEALEWLDKGLPAVFAGHGSSTTSEDVVRIFKQIANATLRIGFVTHAEIVKRNYYSLGSHELSLVLQTLIEGGAIEEVIIPADGRMTKVYKCIDQSFVQKVKANLPRNLKGD